MTLAGPQGLVRPAPKVVELALQARDPPVQLLRVLAAQLGVRLPDHPGLPPPHVLQSVHRPAHPQDDAKQ
jgi:hypothetical protein